MNFTDLMYATEKLFRASFRVLEKLNMNTNKVLFFIGAVAAILWIKRMMEYDREAEQNGTLK